MINSDLDAWELVEEGWYLVEYGEDMALHGDVLPEDGVWAEWMDRDGNIEVARFKYDAEDHFYPHTKVIKKENVYAWRPWSSEGL